MDSLPLVALGFLYKKILALGYLFRKEDKDMTWQGGNTPPLWQLFYVHWFGQTNGCVVVREGGGERTSLSWTTRTIQLAAVISTVKGGEELISHLKLQALYSLKIKT